MKPILVALALVCCAFAAELPDAPDVQGNALSSSARASRVTPVANYASPAASSPIADAKFWGVTATMFGATVANVELTSRCREQRTCQLAPLPMKTRASMYGVAIPADIGLAVLSYKLKKSHRWWAFPIVASTMANSSIAVYSGRLVR